MRHWTRLNLYLLPRVSNYSFSLRSRYSVKYTRHDRKENKKEKERKKKDCARKSVVRVLHPAPFRRGCDKINGLLTTRHFITLGHLSSFSSEKKKKKRTKGAKSEALSTSFRRTASLMVILTRSTSVFWNMEWRECETFRDEELSLVVHWPTKIFRFFESLNKPKRVLGIWSSITIEDSLVMM